MDLSKLYEVYEKSTGVCIDSRKVAEGNIFFALKGEHFDGNDFAIDALKKGALAAVVDDYAKIEQKHPQEIRSFNNNIIVVENSLKTLQSLATFHRRRLGLKVLALTGTNGKTTTKELIKSVLAKKFKTAGTQGNLNNHIGVPLTLLSIPKETEFAVIEMGASKPGDIQELCEIALPDYGLITTIGYAHLEGFGDRETLIKTKNEIFDFLKENQGLIFYNKDNPVLSELVGDYDKSLYFCYTCPGAKVKGKILAQNPYLTVGIEIDGKTYPVKTQLVGKYNSDNILYAVLAGIYFQVPLKEIFEAIEEYTPKNNRSQLEDTGKNLIIRDLYNANPTSMMAALETFEELEAEKKAVILGDMLELGAYADKFHREITEYLAKKNYKVFLVGENFSKNNTNKDFLTFPDSKALAEYLKKNPLRGYLILIKGSRGIRLENVLETL